MLAGVKIQAIIIKRTPDLRLPHSGLDSAIPKPLDMLFLYFAGLSWVDGGIHFKLLLLSAILKVLWQN